MADGIGIALSSLPGYGIATLRRLHRAGTTNFISLGFYVPLWVRNLTQCCINLLAESD